MPKTFVCGTCLEEFGIDHTLRKHYEKFSNHKKSKDFLDCKDVYRTARLKEVAKSLTTEKLQQIFLTILAKQVNTYQYMLCMCRGTQSQRISCSAN